jgi:flagellar biosynthetic protein FlhB
LAIFAGTVFMPWTLSLATGKVLALFRQLPEVIADPEPGRATAIVHQAALAVLTSAAPICIGLLMIGLIAQIAQGGVYPSMAGLKPKFERLNPLGGMKRLFGPHTYWEATKAVIKTSALALVLYMSIKKLIPVLIASGALSVTTVVTTVGSSIISLIRLAALIGLLMSVGDFIVVRRRNMKALRMTKQEVKEESKRNEGDPHLKGAIRSKQLAMSRNRMMADVPTADVVVVNPTHVATALRYDPTRGAPRVVAKGAGAIAKKIRDLATEHRIPMVQDVTLARSLYASCDVGAEVPPELYAAVARVLAFVMGLKRRGSAAGLHHPFGSAVA